MLMKKRLRKTIVAIAFQSFIFMGFCQISSQSSDAQMVINYSVEITETGPVAVGTTVNWTIFANIVSVVGDNFGIATASVSLADNFGDTLTPGTITAPFNAANGYGGIFAGSGGAFSAGTLQNIGIGAGVQTAGSVGQGAAPSGPFSLATGTYTLTTEGDHTLSTVGLGASTNRYFTLADQSFINSSEASITFGSDTVTAVPEPGSALMFGVAMLGLVRRRK